MTAEQLEELRYLKEQLGKDVFYGEERLYNMRKHNPLHLDAINMLNALARRVIAAEKLVKVAERMFEDPSLADVVALQLALTAYREASK